MAKLNARLVFVALLSIATALKDQAQDVPEEASEGQEAPSLMQVETHAEHRHKVVSRSRSMRSEKMFDETQHMAAELAKGAAKMAKEVAKEAAEETAEALSEASDSLGSPDQDSDEVADTQVAHPIPQNNSPSIEKADLEARSKDSHVQYLWRTLEDFLLAESFWLRLLILCSAICLVYMLCVGGQVAAAGDLLKPKLLKKKTDDKPPKIPIEAQKMGGDRRQLYDRNLNTDVPDLNEPSAFHEDRDWRRAVAGGD